MSGPRKYCSFDGIIVLPALTARRAQSLAHLSTLVPWVLAATAFFVTASPLVVLAQLGGPKIPGTPTPTSPTMPTPKAPNITPLTKGLVAEPFSVTMQPTGNGPFYMPGVPNCPPQTFRFDSKGGYAPITWHHMGSMLGIAQDNMLGSSLFELVDTTGKIATAPAPATLPMKPAAPSTRLLRFAGTWEGGGVAGFSLATRLSVYAVDNSGQKRGSSFEIRPTRACGAPVLSGASLASAGAGSANQLVSQQNYTLQTSNFDTRDNLDPMRTRETRITCRYPSGLTVDCLEALRFTGQLGFESEHCPSTAQCRVRIQNLEGSGPVQVRLFNPYGASAILQLNPTFSSSIVVETETLALPSTIAKDPTTVQAGPDLPDYMGEAAPSCPNTYLVWRGMTFSDPSGRAKLVREVKIGARVTPTTLPQWQIAPGSNQISIQANYEVERRQAICPALVVQ